MGIRRCNIWRIDPVIQFNEASLSNSSVNMWMEALSWGSTAARLILPHHFSTMTEGSHSMIDASEGPLIVVPCGRYSVSRTSFIPENDDHHHLSSWSFLAQLSWCLFIWPLPDLGFQLAERIILVNPGLIADYDAITKLVRIYFAVLQELLTAQWTRKGRWIGVNNFGRHRVQTFFMSMWLFMISWIMINSSARRRTETCWLSITIRCMASMFLLAVMVDRRPIRGASSKARSGSLNWATHLATVRYDGAKSL